MGGVFDEVEGRAGREWRAEVELVRRAEAGNLAGEALRVVEDELAAAPGEARGLTAADCGGGLQLCSARYRQAAGPRDRALQIERAALRLHRAGVLHRRQDRADAAPASLLEEAGIDNMRARRRAAADAAIVRDLVGRPRDVDEQRDVAGGI